MYKNKLYFSISVVDVVAVQSLSCVPHSATSWTVPHQVSLSSTISWSLLKFMSIEWVILSNHLMFCGPLLLLPSIFPRIRIFSSELAFHLKFPKYWSFTFTSDSSKYISDSSKEYSPLGLTGLIFLQTKEVKIIFLSTTIYRHQFFNTQPSLWSNSHICTRLLEKTIALTIQTFVCKWCLCFLTCYLGLSNFPSKENKLSF